MSGSGETPDYEWIFSQLVSSRERRSKFRSAEIKIFGYLVRKRNKEATMKELCDIMPASTVSVSINELEKDGFIEKVPKMASDGSLFTIRLLAIPKGVRSYLTPQIRREPDVNSIYFMENLWKFQRICRYAETDTSRELEDIDTRFLFDFSEIHDFLHPDVDQIYPSVGWVLYMFEEKLKNDKYIFPPAAAWEMLRHMETTARTAKKYSDFRTLTKDLRMRKFLNVIKNPSQSPEVAYEKLLDAYAEMKELSGLLILGDSGVVKHLFRDAIRRFKELIAKKILVPLGSVLDDPYKYPVDSDVYLKVLHYLMWRRFFASEKNVIDAMNMALTFQLTDSLYKSDDQYFVLVTHSKKPLEIFYDVKWRDDPKGAGALVREPSFMATRILLHKEFPNPNDRLDYVRHGKEVISYLWEHRDLLDYSERFISTFELGGERVIQEELAPIGRLLSQTKLFEKDLAPQIQRVLEINVEKMSQLRKIVAVDQAKKIQELLQDREEYKNRMIEAHNIIIESVKETYSVLRNFVNSKYKRLLTQEMLDWLKKLDEQL